MTDVKERTSKIPNLNKRCTEGEKNHLVVRNQIHLGF